MAAIKKFDWIKIKSYYDKGHSSRECQRKFGMSGTNWKRAKRRGKIKTRPYKPMLLGRVLSTSSRHHIRRRLQRSKNFKAGCKWCRRTTWRGETLVLELDHIDGDKRNNKIINLRMLCPNCHSQTPTYCRGKVRSEN